MSGISTHVLDTASGKPAAGIGVHLLLAGEPIGSGTTDQDGRVRTLLSEGAALQCASYRVLFDIRNYFPDGFYTEVSIAFAVRDASAHYHIPLLISPFGYTTYRGS
jgi:5-hydroxyisourate hydrolase